MFPWESYDSDYTSAYDKAGSKKEPAAKKSQAKKSEPKAKASGRSKKRS